jgi:hypothetical protein
VHKRTPHDYLDTVILIRYQMGEENREREDQRRANIGAIFCPVRASDELISLLYRDGFSRNLAFIAQQLSSFILRNP